MENNQHRKNYNAGLTALIVMLLIITTIASCVGMYAWARYISSQNGSSTAQVAKWYFNLKTGEATIGAETKTLLNLTRTDGYGHVVEGEIAPGTHGELPIIVDTTGTEVDLEYTVEVVIENCPTNMKFIPTSESTVTETRSGTGEDQDPKIATITITNYVPYSTANADRNHNETLTWNWPYETLDANNSAVAGDIADKADNGKTITVRVKATGTEKLNKEASGGNQGQQETYAEDSVYTLAKTLGTIKRWDKVDYSAPTTASISNADLPSGSGATLSAPISAGSSDNWVVLNVNEETGEVTIIPTTYSVNTLTLTGVNGYNNAVTKTVQGSTVTGTLDTVASIYLNTDYAVSSRCLTASEVNDIEGYVPERDVNIETFGGDSPDYPNDIILNGSRTYNNMRCGMDEDLNLVDYQTRGSREYSITKNTIDYGYETSIMQKHLITKEDCWLASYSWHLYDYCCMFYVRCLRPNYNGQGYMSDNLLVTSYNWEKYFEEESDNDIENETKSACVVPVVTLKPNIHMNKKGDTWELTP